MTLDEVIEYQKANGFGDIHVVYFDLDRFHLAHTDLERQMRQDVGFNLHDCPVHEWLSTFDGPPALGLCGITAREHDGYSDSFRSDASRWQLHPIQIEPLDEE
jgi:hypothetical protein